MHKGNDKTFWKRFCAAMVEHGHGRSADISAVSSQRKPRAKGKGRREVGARKKPGPSLRLRQFQRRPYEGVPAF